MNSERREAGDGEWSDSALDHRTLTVPSRCDFPFGPAERVKDCRCTRCEKQGSRTHPEFM